LWEKIPLLAVGQESEASPIYINMQGSNGQQNWQQFQGTQLGSVLAGIYGNKPKINYPVPKQAKNAFDPAKAKFKPCNAPVVHGAQDPRKTTRRDVNLAVPTGFRGEAARPPALHAISYVPHRRGAAEIKAEMEEVNDRQRHYRPAVRRVIGESEKDRYSQVCAYKGGKIMPADLTPPSSEAPFEILAKLQAVEMEKKFRATRKGLSNRHGNTAPVSTPTRMTQEQELAQQIQAEIEERCNYLEEMKAIGAISKSEIQTLQAEIKSRTLELVNLDI